MATSASTSATGRLRTVLVAVIGLVAVLVAAPSSQADERSRPVYAAQIRYTDYGVPHVKAADYASLGYGIGYASARDNVCELADRMLTVTGQRSRYFGPGAGNANLGSDLYHKRLIETGRLEELLAPTAPNAPSADARALIRGFAAGTNRYLRDVGVANLTDPRCKGKPWVREIDEIDFWRSVLAGQVPTQVAGVAAAQPPAFVAAAVAAAADQPLPDAALSGSNAYAFGDAGTTGDARAVLLGNPHYPWDGLNRFYRMHLTIPGELNVVGAGLMNTPIVGIGHTEHIAWTHTVSTARRFGYFELTLAAGDPTSYVYEGQPVAMERTPVTVDVLQGDGTLAPVTRTFYTTRYGPMVATGTFPWTTTRGFALRTADEGLRVVDQYLAIWQARSVRDLREILGRHQATGFNTTAADSSGEAFYGDMGAVPNVTNAKALACVAPGSTVALPQWLGGRIPVLDGARAACDWASGTGAVVPGLFGPADAPQLFRRDYVNQANDSYWLTNPRQPLTGLPRIYGDEETERSLRTRITIQMAEEQLAASGTDLGRIQEVMFSNRNLGADMARDDLVALCRANPTLPVTNPAGTIAVPAAACDALAQWDRRVNLDSQGAALFRLFAASGGLRWAVPFDVNDPVGTPNTLDTASTAVKAALGNAIRAMQTLQIPFDAPLGSVQTEPRNAERIPIHGGPGGEGIFNVITSFPPGPVLGWAKVGAGSSWVMTVEFTGSGPRSQGILTYSQSTNPTSPHFADQTRAFSEKRWDDLRFTEDEVARGTVERLVLVERAG